MIIHVHQSLSHPFFFSFFGERKVKRPQRTGQVGTTGNDYALGAAVESSGNTYVAAGTTGGVAGKRMMRSGFCEVELISLAACSSWDRPRLWGSNYRDKS